ncbi:MAG: ABC transporter ATP-binding protein [Firmicutes bacterium]|jgi:osmoprotectant transport system ATP-binding protein|nr:ABC transporter ATP-binding protein [Bacillota bacterium]
MIKFENITKTYSDGFQALKNITFNINKGELFVLIGPSGCGKTTTMKMINKLIDSTEGSIKINGTPIENQNPVQLRRNIGYVIQQIGLFPHMTIKENVALVPKLKKIDPEVYAEKVNELLEMVGLAPEIYANRYPKELSGGQQQRVGVIRALAAEPDIILMDEPFSALDPISREQLQEDLINLQDTLHKTIVFVTHDMDEALKIADRICIMKDGEIVQIDTPENVLRHPKNEFVKNFIGEDRLSKIVNLPPIEEALEKPLVIRPNKGLAETIKFLRKNRAYSAVVTDKDNKYLGIVSAWDVNHRFNEEGLTVKDIMKTDQPTVTTKDDLEHAIEIIFKSKIGYLPVLDDDNFLMGIATKGSLMEIMADEFLDI